jgi:hydroxyacylglutathione hydrolase
MHVTRLVLGPLDTNCWVVGDDLAGPVVVIDPAEDADAILATAGERPVAMIVLTHGHFDHIGAVRDLVARTAAPLAAHELDAARVTTAEGAGGVQFGFDITSPSPTVLLADGEHISAGELDVEVLHTPGHTPGGICLLVREGSQPAQLFSGDTLFAGSVGRTDFPGGDARALSRSIAEKLAPLPLETIVHPGHGPDTTIERERRVNFFWPRG